MNKLYTLVGMALIGMASVSAQTLSFSRVLLVDGNVSTVPAGKVWKVENLMTTGAFVSSSTTNTSTPSPSNYYTYFVNGVEYSCSKMAGDLQAGYSSSTSSQSKVVVSPDRDLFPFWLPAGSTLATGTGINQFSVIEFTVNP